MTSHEFQDYLDSLPEEEAELEAAEHAEHERARREWEADVDAQYAYAEWLANIAENRLESLQPQRQTVQPPF